MNPFEAMTNLRHFINDPLKFMNQVHQKQGEIAVVFLGPKKFYFIRHLGAVEEILNSKAHHYKKSRLIFNKIKPITGERGLVQLESDEWSEMRQITNKAFYKHHLENYSNIIHSYVESLIQTLRDSIKLTSHVDFSQLMIQYTINIGIRILFGKFHKTTCERIANKFIALNHLCGLKMRQLINMPLIFPTQLNKNILKLQRELEKDINDLIDSGLNDNEFSLLSELNESLKNHRLAKQLIKEQMMTFIFAGYETTAASLSFCFYLLAKHPHYQEKIRQQLPNYTSYVYKEALRLYPPAYMLAREVVHPNQLFHYHLKKGQNIILSIHEIHKHNLYWENPDEFKPERFSKSNELNKFSYLPFGYGKRICSGIQLAMMEANVILEKLINNFNFTLPKNSELRVEAMVTLHPKNNLNLIVESI